MRVDMAVYVLCYKPGAGTNFGGRIRIGPVGTKGGRFMFDLEEELKKLPAKPGVYIMHDAHDAIIYVGKAISLKNRRWRRAC